jgi:aminoglycoside 3-N-acetyltransferase
MFYALKRLKRHIPEPVRNTIRSWKLQSVQKRLSSLPPFSENDLYRVLTEDLGIQKGNVVFFHSSAEKLRPSFPLHHVLTILRDVVGEDGTLLTPTYPRQLSSEFLKNDFVFDVRKTPSYMGILSELFRRTKNAIRSLHPTKSVCAIGPCAQELTSTHQNSPYPYDICSPYYKVMQYNGIIVSLGVSPLRLSFVHCVEDVLKERFPFNNNIKTLF